MEEKLFCDLFYDIIFWNVTMFVILLNWCKCVFHLCAVSLKNNVKYKIEKLSTKELTKSISNVIRSEKDYLIDINSILKQKY